MFFQTFQENEKLRSFFSVLSTNVAQNEVHFVSTIEGDKIIFLIHFTNLITLALLQSFNNSHICFCQVRDIPSTEHSGTQRWIVFSGTESWTFLTPLMLFCYLLCWPSFLRMKVKWHSRLIDNNNYVSLFIKYWV